MGSFTFEQQRYEKTGNKKRATRFATLLQKELNSDVAMTRLCRFHYAIRNTLIGRRMKQPWVEKPALSEDGAGGLLDQHLVIGEPLRSFQIIRIRIIDLRSQDHGRSNEPMNPCPVNSSVYLIYYDPSALGSLILIRIISKKRTLNVRYLGISVRFPRLSSWETSGLSGKQN